MSCSIFHFTISIVLLFSFYTGYSQIFEELPNNMVAVVNGDITCGDYNSDGYFDVLITGEDITGKQVTRVYENNGDNTFRTTSFDLPALPMSDAIWYDFDYDGDLDAYLSGISNDGSLDYLFLNLNDTLVSFDTTIDEAFFHDHFRFDYDNDGDLDSVYITDTRTYLLKNDGQENFYETFFVDLPGFSNASFDIIDFNNDDKMDLIFSGQDSSGAYVTKTYLNQLDITNHKPTAPTNLDFDYTRLKCSWQKATDIETIQEALFYNFRIMSFPDSIEYTPTLSRADGKRLVNLPGNVFWDTTVIIDVQLDTSVIYLWSVQTIDFQFTGSEWSVPDTLYPYSHPVPRLNSLVGTKTDEYNIPISISWYQPIFGFDSTDISITNGSLVSFTNETPNRKWVAIVNPDYRGPVTIQIPPAIAQNEDSLGNLAPKPLSIDYAPFTRIAYELPDKAWTSTSWGDIDRDGDMDIVATNDTVSEIFENTGNGNFNALASTFAGNCDNLGDYNNDGYLDIITKDPVQDGQYSFTNLYKNNGDKTFSSVPHNFESVNKTALWGDFNLDGKLDVLLSGLSDFQGSITCLKNDHEHLDIYKNEGNGNFTKEPVDLNALDGYAIWADLNDDGFLDILTSGKKCYQSGVSGFKGDEKSSYLNIEGNFFIEIDREYENIETITMVDYDNDHDLDMLYNSILLKKKTKNVSVPAYTFEGEGKAAWADLNNDGFLDVVRGSLVYLNNQHGGFTLLKTNLKGTGPVSCADFDNDGDLDILLGRWVYKNNIKKPNNKPSTPENPIFDSISFVFSWQPSTDKETPQEALSYNLRIGSSPGAGDIISPNALENGKGIVSGYGNLGQSTMFSYGHFEPGKTYYWSLQAVDNQWGRSDWSNEQVIDFTNYTSVELQTVKAPIDTPYFDVKVIFSNSVIGFDSSDINLSNAEITNFQVIEEGVRYLVSLAAKERNVTVQIPAGATSNGFGKSNFPSNLAQVIFNEYAIIQEQTGNKFNLYHDVVLGHTDTTDNMDILSSYSDLSGSYTAINDTLPIDTYNGAPLAWGDFTSNGFMDVILCNGNCRVYENNGDGNILAKPEIITVPGNASTISAADIDNDGDLDLHINSLIYYNDGQGNFKRATSADGVPYLWGKGASWGDYNNDGYPDLLKKEFLYLNESGEKFSLVNAGITGNGRSAWADLNNDGFLDIVLGDKIYVNSGSGNFSEVETSMQRTENLNIGDYNNDGYLDILNGINLYKNNGDLNFTFIQTEFANISGQAVWGDLDSDNDLDVYIQGTDKKGLGYKAIYDNQISQNKESVNFTNLNAGLQQHMATFSWEVEDNHSYSTYNVRVGVTPGGEELVRSGNNKNNIRMVPSMGNAQTAKLFKLDLTNLLEHLPSNKLYWSVQPVYHNYTAGAWAPEQELPINAVADFYAPTVCALDTTQFKDLSFGSQFDKWIWDFGDGTKDTITSAVNGNTSHVFSKGGNYNVTLTVFFGAVSNSITKTINILYTPDASFKIDTICEGDMALFTDLSNTDSIISPEYIWDFGDGSVSVTPGNISHAYTKPDTAYLYIVTENECYDVDSQTVVVTAQPSPIIVLEVSGQTKYCEGDTIKLMDENSDPEFNYQWYVSGLKLFGETDTSIRRVQEHGSYTFKVDVTNPSGKCTVSDEETIEVYPMPEKPNIYLKSSSDIICPNETVSLAVEYPSDKYEYTWLKNGMEINLEGFEISAALNEGDYSIRCSKENCSIQSAPITINYKTSLVKPDLYVFGPNVWYFACSNDSAQGGYRWQLNGSIVEESDDHMYFAINRIGSYHVEINDGQNNCWVSSDTINIPSDDYIGKEYQPLTKSAAYPNPVTESFTIDLSDDYLGDVSIRIIDSQGIIQKEIFLVKDRKDFSHIINISNLSKGAYTIQVHINNAIKTLELIKI